MNIDLYPILTGFDTARIATPAHHRLMKRYASPLLLGPPPSDDLLELIMHMFTEDEADVMQHIPIFLPRSAQQVARRSGRPKKEVEKILDNLADIKVVILAFGYPRKYAIVPIVPGVFEMSLLTTDVSSRNAWHKKFAQLFERMWDKGYMTDYFPSSRPPIRYLPVGEAVKTLNMAWPSDMLEEILEPYKIFAKGNCQCRIAMQLVGKGCDKPLENCVTIGPMAITVIRNGMMRRADRQEIIEIKRDAERKGCVTWMMNEYGSLKGNISCSCCGCCCHGLRSISQFNTPGMISKPHFMPVWDETKCIYCKKCIEVCPMGTWNLYDGKLKFNSVRCIGCGLCVVSCSSGALTLKPLKDADPPESSWIALLLKMAPGYIINTVRVWARRLNQY